jgi:hypothetical protein
MSDSGKLRNNIIIMVFMNFLLATVYMTAFVYAGMMGAWEVK